MRNFFSTHARLIFIGTCTRPSTKTTKPSYWPWKDVLGRWSAPPAAAADWTHSLLPMRMSQGAKRPSKINAWGFRPDRGYIYERQAGTQHGVAYRSSIGTGFDGSIDLTSSPFKWTLPTLNYCLCQARRFALPQLRPAPMPDSDQRCVSLGGSYHLEKADSIKVTNSCVWLMRASIALTDDGYAAAYSMPGKLYHQFHARVDLLGLQFHHFF